MHIHICTHTDIQYTYISVYMYVYAYIYNAHAMLCIDDVIVHCTSVPECCFAPEIVS